jgi:hypothetical protein
MATINPALIPNSSLPSAELGLTIRARIEDSLTVRRVVAQDAAYQWRLRLDARHRCFVKSGRGARGPVYAVVFDSGEFFGPSGEGR